MSARHVLVLTVATLSTLRPVELAAQVSLWIDDSTEQVGETILQVQNVVAVPDTATSSVTTSLFNQSPPSDGGTGWLDNVFLSSTRAFIDVASPAILGGVSSAFLQPTIDASTLFQNVPGIDIGMRAPGHNEAVLGGRRLGQSIGEGSYWFPARQDLDTILSKLDGRLIDEIVAIDGPYSALYGPGLSFFDVDLLDTPRYQDGFQSHGSTSADYETNGQRWHGRQAFWGGSSDWGYRVGYGHRTGNDYVTGAGVGLPASYKSRILDVGLGANLTGNDNVEIHALRLDQTDVEFPGQWFDINFLVTDAYEFTYTVEGQRRFDTMSLEAWYNRTRFEGDNVREGKHRVIPLSQLIQSTTDVDAMSTGYRIALGWDDIGLGQLTAGTDLRYLKQQLNGFDTFFGFQNITGIPRSHWSNPGLFLETSGQPLDRLNVRGGGRVDWVSTNADSENFTTQSGSDLEQVLLGGLDQHFNLWSMFFLADYALSDRCTLELGCGHGMRAPTLTELYAANAPIIAALPQTRATAVIGDPNLSSERMWQVDVGLRTELHGLHTGVNGFYSWINDYVTFDLLDGDTLYAYTNTDLATIAGFGFFLDYELAPWLTTSGTLSYIEGRDLDRARNPSTVRQAGRGPIPGASRTIRSDSSVPREPLPVMPPLQSRLALIFHEPSNNPVWSVELAVRLADEQDRVATSLLEEPTESYGVFDILAFARLGDHLTLTSGVLNVTDEEYRTYFDARRTAQMPTGIPVYQPGLTFYFGTELMY